MPPMSVSHPKIKVMLANHSTGAIWAFPVKGITIERSATKTLHQEWDDSQITHFWKCIVPFFVTNRFFLWFTTLKSGFFPHTWWLSILYTLCPCLHLLWPFSIIIDFLHIMYQSNSIICICTNLNLAFLFFEFRPRLQNPIPTFKPASHPIITGFSAIVISNPPLHDLSSQHVFAVFRPHSSCLSPSATNNPLTTCPQEGNITCPLFPIGPVALDHIPCPRRQNHDNINRCSWCCVIVESLPTKALGPRWDGT
jgi:hypothetical protein